MENITIQDILEATDGTLLYKGKLCVPGVRAVVGQNGPAANIPDHSGIYHIKLCVIHQKPAFPRALQCGGFDAGFLRVRRGKALRRAYAVGTHKRFGKVVVL